MEPTTIEPVRSAAEPGAGDTELYRTLLRGAAVQCHGRPWQHPPRCPSTSASTSLSAGTGRIILACRSRPVRMPNWIQDKWFGRQSGFPASSTARGSPPASAEPGMRGMRGPARTLATTTPLQATRGQPQRWASGQTAPLRPKQSRWRRPPRWRPRPLPDIPGREVVVYRRGCSARSAVGWVSRARVRLASDPGAGFTIRAWRDDRGVVSRSRRRRHRGTRVMLRFGPGLGTPRRCLCRT
jgi:hypothetical protein